MMWLRYACAFMFLYVCMCVYVYVYVCVMYYVYTHAYIHIYTYIHTYIYIYICIYSRRTFRNHPYKHTHISIHTYIRTQTSAAPPKYFSLNNQRLLEGRNALLETIHTSTHISEPIYTDVSSAIQILLSQQSAPPRGQERAFRNHQRNRATPGRSVCGNWRQNGANRFDRW